jgi:hypothetical protein
MAFAQNKYPADSIPVFLKIGADAVVRSEQKNIVYVNEKKAYIEYSRAVTILNESGEENYSEVHVSYDDFSKVSGISGSVYDENGKLVKSLKKYDVYDIKSFDGPEMLDDSRMKVFQFPSYNYPYTIEYSYRIDFKYVMFYPLNFLQNAYRTSVEQSGLQCVIPEELDFNFKAMNLKNPTDSFRTRSRLYLTWQEENLEARQERDYAPSPDKSAPKVFQTSLSFDYHGYQGSFNSWKAYGDWVNKLNAGRDVLDKEYADKARALVQGIPDRRAKIKALYEYMQKNTRYFYVGFDIGGEQPMPANDVAKNGYGDCKALSNYMKALLKAAGIESYYTLVFSGAGENIESDFPSDQFNHIILCVPDGSDTIWLECTNQTIPFNFLGSFTSDRDVLAITPDGGKILRTPEYGKKDNVIHSTTEVSLSESGNADINIQMSQSGIIYESLKAISEEKTDIRNEWIAGLLGHSNIDIQKEDFNFYNGEIVPIGSVKLEVQVRDFCSKSSNRLFVNPSVLSKLDYIWNEPTDIELNIEYQQNDTVKIEIPSGYAVEYLPRNTVITTKYGEYASQITSDGKFVYHIRRLDINSCNYSREYYPEVHKFISDIATADRQMLIFKASQPGSPGTRL